MHKKRHSRKVLVRESTRRTYRRGLLPQRTATPVHATTICRPGELA